MRVIVLGAGGIIGQHMMAFKPHSIDAVFCRRDLSGPFVDCDITDYARVFELIKLVQPEIVINLAGENRVDVVENDPDAYYKVNVLAVNHLASLCEREGVHLIQASTQGVFSGDQPPYQVFAEPDPITEYGKQKAEAEKWALKYGSGSIARITFVLGVRPFQNIGRVNPLEQMFSEPIQKQENDRYFSVAFASDAAECLWDLCMDSQRDTIVHIGQPIRTSRFEIASSTFQLPRERLADRTILPVSYKDFESNTHRPIDTTWAIGSRYMRPYNTNMQIAYNDWKRNGLTNTIT